jgi:hypothetical protein
MRCQEPACEVVERHRIRVSAPAQVTLAVARDQNLLTSPLVRAIFKGRELVLREDRVGAASRSNWPG